MTRQMALMREAGGEGDLRDRQVAILQQRLGPLDAPAQYVLMDRDARRVPEQVFKCETLSARDLRDLRERQVAFQIVFDVREQLLELAAHSSRP